ncbi:MAG: DNA repair protein RadC [Treponema bryantii]|jgi:DNA repair protein RadC|nr:DNA repair protein RadC [Treponema bryantii]MBR2106388.1 DNA repair protein RadC [Treponema sp.]MBR6583776.1 DNA repair protein RadC [Treponema sp.]
MDNKNKPDIRERTIENGLLYPTNVELIMLILGSGNKQMSVDVMAQKINDVLTDSNIDDVVKNLLSVKGVGQGKALAVAAALELGRRHCSHLKALIQTPEDILPYVQNYAMCAKEHFVMITLNGGHEIIKIHLISVGTVSKTIIHPREVFREAIKENASSIVICHNHPSGNCVPSDEDIETTKFLIKASNLIGIPILDHIIFDCDSYYSFLEHDFLFKNKNLL